MTQSPAVADGTIYIGHNKSNLYALDAESGEWVWEQPFKIDDGGFNSLAVADGTVYVGGGNSMYAVTTDGAQQ